MSKLGSPDPIAATLPLYHRIRVCWPDVFASKTTSPHYLNAAQGNLFSHLLLLHEANKTRTISSRLLDSRSGKQRGSFIGTLVIFSTTLVRTLYA